MESNNIVNNLFTNNIDNIEVQDFIKDLGAAPKKVTYTFKSLIPTYIALKSINKDLLVVLIFGDPG